MSKPKIAILIDWYLPGTKAGGPVRSIYSLVNLLKTDFNFYIITTNKDLKSKEEYPNIKPNELFTEDGINYFYFDAKFLTSKNMFNLLNQISPNLIYLNSFWSFNFSVNIIKLRHNIFKKTPIILAPRGMLSKGAMSLKSFKKNIFITLSRNLGWHKNIVFHATNEQEKNDILLRFKTEKVKIAPNVNVAVPLLVNKIKQVNHVNLFFLSRISPVKNLHFALQLLQFIPSDYTVSYDIFGNVEDENYWNSCLKIITELPQNITVTYKGELQFNQVQNTICNYHFLFLPTLNENFGHSIVESLLSGCPIIISDQTPWNDCEKNKAGFALSLDNKQNFIEKIINCAKLTQQEYNQTSKSAIDYITNKLNLTENINTYKNLFMSSLTTDLSTFNNYWYKPGGTLFKRTMWYIISKFYFKSSFPFYGFKRFLLRLFGAKIGKGLIIKPHVSIKYPWKLVIGDHVWIGENVWIDNLAPVTIKSHACISQGAMLLCGNHNYKRTTFDLMVGSITIEEGAWAGAQTVICPGVRMGSHSLLTVGSVATNSLEEFWIYQGNPAQKLKKRVIKA